ncbi:MAG: dienelactone hydrolase family protein, partial [Gloeobacteraceae cyanobacterium ES-bin-316]|nr:dienelactone hydrolase family protein [Ferruginibacter sp.]
MKFMKQSKVAAAAFLLFCAGACNSNSSAKTESSMETKAPEMQIKEQAVTYTVNNVTMNGWVAYDSASDKKRPVVLVVHEWWGLNDYAKSRAKKLAELGYLAMAVDFYGNGQQADNPELAGKLATPFYQDAAMAKGRFDAALNEVKKMAVADTNQIAAIGYCFGGAQVLNMARLGSPLKGVVSFHGNLVGVPADKSLLTAPVLVCHGEADPFVPAAEVAQFKKQMDSIGATYTFKGYADATHAFTNPGATEMGKKFSIPIAYNAAADSSSW